MEARRERRALPGSHLLGSSERGREDGGREDRRACDRGPGPDLSHHHERLRLYGRRRRDGLAPRLAAQGHGVHAVPPDHALSDRDPAHRGVPRRGCLPDQQRRRAVHEALRAECDGAGFAGRRLPFGADRDRRGPGHQRLRDARHAPPRSGADHRAAAGLARAVDDLCRGGSDLRPGPGAPGRPLPHGWCRDGQRRRDRADRPVCGGRGRVRFGRTARTGSAATR